MVNRVSIVIPCYNKEPFVTEAIASALNQTHPHCEVIVIDDGSTDGSLNAISRFGARIRWTSGPNRGGSAARNVGIAMASGDYLQFLDADDTLAPTKIEFQLAALRGAPANSMASCPWRFFSGDGTEEDVIPRPFWRDYDNGIDLLLDTWLNGGYFPCHAWLTPRSLVDAVGGWNPVLSGDDDGEFVGRLLTRASAVRFASSALVGYRRPPAGSVSRTRSLKGGMSFLRAWESVSAAIADRRSDIKARRASLRRLRHTCYALREFPEIVELGSAHERHLALFDLSPTLPRVSRWLIGCLGLKAGLRLRRLANCNDPDEPIENC